MLGFLLALGYTALLLWVMDRSTFFRSPGLTKRTVGALFLIKIGAGTVLWYIYTYVYTDRASSDIYKFFDSGNTMYAVLWTNPGDFLRMLFGIGNDSPYFDKTYYIHINHWYRAYESNMYNDAHTMIRFNAVLRLFSFGYYHVHTVFTCFLSTTGLVALHKAFAARLKGHEHTLVVALFLMPSVLFWGSGVVKESLLLFGLGLFVRVLLEFQGRRFSLWQIPVLAFSVLLLFTLKFYVLLSLLPALTAYFWSMSTGDRKPLLKFAITYAGFITLGLNSDLFYRDFRILEVLWVKQRDFIGMATAANSGSLVNVTELEPNVWSFLRAAPHALYMTLLSPLTAWGNGPLGIMSALENILLLLLTGMAVRWRRAWSEVDKPLLYFCLGYCILLALVIGWTTPVIGALVRYRVPLLPFLLLAGMCIADPKKIPWPRWVRTNTLPE